MITVALVVAALVWIVVGRLLLEAQGHRSEPLEITFDLVPMLIFAIIGAAIAIRWNARQWETEETLRASELRYRMLLEEASDAIFVADTSGRFLEVNRAACDLLGYTRDELLELSFLDLGPPSLNPGQATRLDQIHEGQIVRSERTARRKDGSLATIDLSARWLPDGRFHAIVRDVSERKVVEDALVASRAELAGAQRIAHVGSWTRDASGDSLAWSDEMYRIYGLEAGGPPPTLATLMEYYDADTLARRSAVVEHALAAAEPYELEYDITRADRSVRRLIAHGEPLTGTDGAVVGFRGTVADITELRDAQAQLDQARRAEMVGRLAGGIAHDFNNLLAVINGNAEFLGESIPADDPRREELDAISGAGTRAAALTRQLLAFGRRRALRPSVVDVDDVVADLVPMLRSLVGDMVELVVLRSDPVGHVRVDRTELEQAIVNLVLNARDAMPGSGRVTIETADETIEADDARLRRLGAPGAYVRLTVADTGTGIGTAALPHIFEPFFTTKALGHGTGLGLSSVEGTIAQSGGFVTVDSIVGEGSRFSIHLPRSSGEPVTPPTGASETADFGGSESLLLVEDDPGVRALVGRTLRELGYSVVEAADPAAALSIVRGPTTQFDMLVTDVAMPGMDGRELATTMSTMVPGLPTLFISGYPREQVFGDRLLQRGDSLLMKPFSREELAARVRAMLDQGPPVVG